MKGREYKVTRQTNCSGVVERFVFPVEKVDELVVVEHVVTVEVTVLNDTIDEGVIALDFKLEANFPKVIR